MRLKHTLYTHVSLMNNVKILFFVFFKSLENRVRQSTGCSLHPLWPECFYLCVSLILGLLTLSVSGVCVCVCVCVCVFFCPLTDSRVIPSSSPILCLYNTGDDTELNLNNVKLQHEDVQRRPAASTRHVQEHTTHDVCLKNYV